MSDQDYSTKAVERNNIEEQKKNKTASKWRNSFWCFLVVYMIFSFTHGVQGSYFSSILTTIERKFKLPSIVAGTVGMVSSLGYMISAVLVSFFIPSRLRVRTFAFCMLCTGLCSIFYSLPHFLYPTILHDSFTRNTSHLDVSNSHELCLSPNPILRNSLSNSENSLEVNHSPNWTAVMLFCIAEVLHGLGGAPIWTIGISMIDDHTPIALSSKLIGFMFLARFISPVISYGMGAFFLTFPDHLEASSMTTTDPEWIGAWWLGFMVCFIINILIAIPTFFLADEFQKVGYSKVVKKVYQNTLVYNEKKLVVEDKLKSIPEVPEREVGYLKDGVEKSDENIEDQTKVVFVSGMNIDVDDDEEELPIEKRTFKELLLAVWRLLKNPIYVLVTTGVCLDCFVLNFYSFLPKYVEVHFKQTAWQASLLGGMIPALAGGIMSYGGGVICGKFKASHDKAVNSNVKFSVATCVVSIFIMLSLVFIPCLDNYLPQGYDQATQSVSLNNTCNTACKCDVGGFDPVCVQDGVASEWYTSACQAACTHYSKEFEIYSNCTCITEGSQTVKKGYCDDGCEWMLALYVTCMVLFCFCINIYNVPIVNVTLKCVSKRDKSIAMAFQTVAICITIFPSPILFGGVIDQTCILWQTSSHNDSTGSCLAYHHYYFRLALHGCLYVGRVLMLGAFSLAFYFSSRNLKRIQNNIKNNPIILTEIKQRNV